MALLSWLPWVKNSEEPHRGFNSGEKHWSNHKCEGSGHPPLLMEITYRGSKAYGLCVICDSTYRVTIAGDIFNHKKKGG